MFFPKNTNFAILFQEITDNIVNMFNLFKDLTNEYKNLDSYAKKAEIIEKQADVIVHDVVYQLNTSFITPFDREDLHKIVVEIDNIVDFIEDVFHMLSLYDVSKKPDFMDKFSEIYIDFSDNLNKLITETFKSKRDMWSINNFVVAIKTLERQADEIYITSLQKLFSQEKDPIELIKKKDILEKLETVADNYKFVSDSIINMLIKMW